MRLRVPIRPVQWARIQTRLKPQPSSHNFPVPRRSRFNQVKPKNEVEVRVYEVLSHKNWGASSTLMNEIAQDTFDYERCEFIYLA